MDNAKPDSKETQKLMPLSDSLSGDIKLAHQMYGRQQMAASFAKVSTVAHLLELKRIKETKVYKHLANPESSDASLFSKWSDFCQVMVGTSSRTIDEQLQNLDVFGQDAIDGINTMGLGVRQLRQLRKLPDDEIEQAKQLAKENDKDSLLGLIEDQAMEKANLKEDLKKAEEINEQQNNENIALNEEVEALKDAQTQSVAGSEYPEHVSLFRKEAPVLAEEALADLFSIDRLATRFTEFASSDPKEQLIHRNAALLPALSNVASIAHNALNLFHKICDEHQINPEDIATFSVPMNEGELEVIDASRAKVLGKRLMRGEDRTVLYRKSKAVKYTAGRPFEYL